jgi:enamine deaminase RidA (YjgF/YER057c/UK114 family)
VTLQLINPEGLPVPSTYTHVVVATGTTMVFIAGQEPEDAHGNLVGAGDLAAQARQVFANLGRALDAAGAAPGQVPRSRSTSFTTGPSACRPSSTPENACSASTSQPTSWWEWRRYPSPGT